MKPQAVAISDALAALPDLLRRGPSPDALRSVTGSKAPPILQRTLFSDRRPLQLVYRQGNQTVIAEYHGSAAEAEADALRSSLAKSRRGLRAMLDAGAVVADPETGLILRRPGLDARLPGLRLLHDTDAARALLTRIEGSDPGAVTTTLMAHRLGKRAVIRLTPATGPTRYLRLRAVKSRTGQTAFDRHRALWAAARGSAALILPEPLGEEAALGATLFAALPGAPPGFDGPGAGQTCRAIAEAIASLQALPLTGLPHHDGAAEARLLRDWFGRFQIVFPDDAADLALALQQVTDALMTHQPAPVPCHRDLHEKQILIDGPLAGLLDFDTVCLGAPAMDPGNLLAHLALADILKESSGHAEATMAAALTGPEDSSLRLWRRAALLRLRMIYAFTDMAAAHLNALLQAASLPHDQ
ncbi:phosphotransferase family protein [Palleronia caenipelagi]|uniref:Aminoglycoside phosphotransferase family protein n=1 Tax=Palleronia caenipelagi TaxID=2489174 RepID=A0A547PPD7_9RHOB|nr:aminoglycoside phosphotransferase family protein [Palleronia caenipelagi]TRD16006.1 aminoglycoside phosphotransferase family protein [Palleronia caenipelagi]